MNIFLLIIIQQIDLKKFCGSWHDSNVKVIFNARNFGPNRSGSYGMLQGTGDAVICIVCDLQDPPEMIPTFLKKWEEGYKVVLGQKTKTTL